MKAPQFLQAVPVWPEGRGEVWNQLVGFLLSWEGGDSSTILRITGADCYRIWCNGKHAGYGPARAAHGYGRVDEWRVDAFVSDGLNHVAIEVLTYGIDSYAHAMQPPFLQAEIVTGNTVVAGTAAGMKACPLPERIQKVERFSKQRPFAEAYRLKPDANDWRVGKPGPEEVLCNEVAGPQLLPRGVRYPGFDMVYPEFIVARGAVGEKDPIPPIAKSAQRDGVGVRVMGYPVDELEIDMTVELNAMAFTEDDTNPIAYEDAGAQSVPAAGHTLYDFGIVQGGFIGAQVCCDAPTRVYLMFDELRDRGDKAFVLGIGAIAFDLEPGVHELESFETYTFRFVRAIAVDAAIEVESLYVREFAHPAADAMPCPEDPELAKIFRAARQTFRTNSIDIFTDCMSRERGGYPCDSWFTARAERVLAGESLVEHNFLENYFLVDTFQSIPEGMVPHCYPSDRLGKGQYIPNWGLWLVLELCEYYRRTGDAALLDLARPRVEALFDWFKPSVNDQGLLEDVPGWIFVEWSKANDCTGAVNHPTNMLYAQCLDAAGEVFDGAGWGQQAEKIREEIRRESWDGNWFADQSVRVNGKLQRSEIRSETCQYHALYFGIAEGAEYKALWPALRDNWGPCREDDGELVPAGLLYGLMLRFDLLQRFGEKAVIDAELRHVFGPQAALTGTLWEHVTGRSSCNHGFASCAAEYLLGITT